MNFFSENNNTIVTQNLYPMETSNASLMSIDNTSTIIKNENNIPSTNKSCNRNQSINQIWTKENFVMHKGIGQKKSYLKASLSLNIKPLKTTWASKKSEDIVEDNEEDKEVEYKPKPKRPLSPSPSSPEKEIVSPPHHARRPMNAFLIFCKKHRPIVRQRFPHLENRGVTRILGEWWALLDANEKSSYTSLAKEYKDAFFSANPDFKWYKLPAPPLRTLNTRPVGFHKTSSPLASPTQVTPNSAEFTPGKLADETQLGNLTSLMKFNNITSSSVVTTPSHSNMNVCNETIINSDDDQKSNSSVNNNNNNVENDSEQHKQLLVTPVAARIVATDFPPKPIKKRKFEFGDCDNKKVVRNIFDTKPDDELLIAIDQNENSYIEEQLHNSEQTDNCTNGFRNSSESENMTQQELMNKIVDSMFPQKDKAHKELNKNGRNVSKQKSKETRKSGRSCKGKRYVEFMMQGKLLGNKQTKRLSQYKLDISNKFDNALNNKIENMMHNKSETQTPKLDLGDTIKRLAERTNKNLEDVSEEAQGDEDVLANNNDDNGKRKRTDSENSDDSLIKLQSDFNLNLRIAKLPSLSYETFLQRKKESKKRKSIRSKSESSITKTKVMKLSKSESNSLVGSKKRKNKNSITRLEKPVDSNYMSNFNNDLYGLATLAEVAANTEKIN